MPAIKSSRGTRVIQRQIEDLESMRAGLDTVEQNLERALRSKPPGSSRAGGRRSASGSPAVLHRYSPKRKPAAPPAQASRKEEIPTRLLPKRSRTQDAWRSRLDAATRETITLRRLARGNDLFFHLEGYPGSHVVLRTEGRTDPPTDSLLDACELAAHFSKLKNAGPVDIHVAPIKK